MPKKKYLVTLDDDEREQLEHLLHSGTHATRKVTRARILLKAAEGWQDSAIAAALAVGRATVERLRQRFVEQGLGALEEQPRRGTQPKLDAKAEARLIAEACSAAPEGRQRWTLHLLADQVVALGLAPSYSWLFAIIWAEPKSFHNRLISVFSDCVHFATQRPAVESA